MTKTVRIENADTSNFKVVVEVWDAEINMPNGDFIPARLVETRKLDYPTAMTDPYITSTRFLIIKESA